MVCTSLTYLSNLILTDLGVIAGVIVAPDFLRVTKNPDSNYLGFIVSSMLLGAFVGCIPASLIADAFSRRFAIMVGAIVFILGGVLQTAAQNQGMMLAGRFFAGVGIGMLSLLARKSQIRGSQDPVAKNQL